MKEFTFSDLKIATQNFTEDNLLGKGGFGAVYKGLLEEKTLAPSKSGTGMAVAIKILNHESKQGLREWQAEVKVLERQSHPNLVKFIGYCSEDEELLLVYEFMQRGSLFDHLFRRNTGIEPLSWDMRIKIAIGAARGLNFLHTLEKKVIHRDVTSSNILLDSDYNAKIADFGLARFLAFDWNSHATTTSEYNCNISNIVPLERLGSSDGHSYVSTQVKGTFGYLDPDYARTGHLYVESDVYSFGVVLLELMAGLRALDIKRPEGQENLVIWLKPILSKKCELEKIMDSTMEGQFSSEAMLLTAKLASRCTNDDHRRRPSMGKVLKELQHIDALKGKEKE